MKIVIKIGGSIFFDKEGKINYDLLLEYSKEIRHLHELGHEVGVVTGGGSFAKQYLSQIRSFNFVESVYDIIGIEFSRINALVFSMLLGDIAIKPILTSWDQVMQHIDDKRIIVLGGMQPGQSTNAVSAILAEYMSAEYLINLTNVEGVFDRPPTQAGAKLLRKITYQDFLKILFKQDSHAGHYELFDLVAFKIVSRSKIKLVFINGMNPKNLLDCLSGKKIGTLVWSNFDNE